jgi:hypothetical protein
MLHRRINNFSFSFSKCKHKKARVFGSEDLSSGMWQCHWLIYWFLLFWRIIVSSSPMVRQSKKKWIAWLLKIKLSHSFQTMQSTHAASCSSLLYSWSPVKFHCSISILCAEYFGLNSDLHWHQLHYTFSHFTVEINLYLNII